jgi:methoxymalonate biosynthesis acyl carrier protein
MTDHRDLEAQIAHVFLSQLQVDVPGAEVDLFATGIVDSLMFVRLLALLEAHFAIRVSFEELEIDDFRTLRQIATFVATKRAGLAAPRRVSASG